MTCPMLTWDVSVLLVSWADPGNIAGCKLSNPSFIVAIVYFRGTDKTSFLPLSQISSWPIWDHLLMSVRTTFPSGKWKLWAGKHQCVGTLTAKKQW